MREGVDPESVRRIESAPLSTAELSRLDGYWRAANYLSVGPDLLTCQRPSATATRRRRREATAPGPLGNQPRTQHHLRAPQPAHRARRPRHDLRDRSRPRWSRDPRQHVARGQLHRDVSGHHARRRRHGAALQTVLVPGRSAEPRCAGDAGIDSRRRRAGLLDRARVRRRVRQSRSRRRVRCRRR